MSTQIDRLTELAKEDAKRQFYSIAHMITFGALYAAFRGLRKKASAGVDGVTYEEYERDVAGNLQTLHGGSRMASIRPNLCAESISSRKTGSRDQSRFPPWRIRSCRRRWSKY